MKTVIFLGYKYGEFFLVVLKLDVCIAKHYMLILFSYILNLRLSTLICMFWEKKQYHYYFFLAYLQIILVSCYIVKYIMYFEKQTSGVGNLE